MKIDVWHFLLDASTVAQSPISIMDTDRHRRNHVLGQKLSSNCRNSPLGDTRSLGRSKDEACHTVVENGNRGGERVGPGGTHGGRRNEFPGMLGLR